MAMQGDADESSFSVKITEDTRLKGDPTPGTHTPVEDVPKGEIENFEGEVVGHIKSKTKAKKSAKKKAKKPTKPSILVTGEKVYGMFANGMTWQEITASEGINSPWMAAKKFADFKSFPYPPEKQEEKGLVETISDSIFDNEFPEEDPIEEKEAEAVPLGQLPPVLPEFKLYELAKFPHLEKTAMGHTHTLEFRVGHDVRQFGLQGEPTAQEVLAIISRESRKK